MRRTLKAALALLCLAELVASVPREKNFSRHLSDITHGIQQLSRGAQVPCNDTRVAQVVFTDWNVKENFELKEELLCQAAKVLASVTRCKKDYEPFITSLQSLHGKTSCSLSTDEIYLRNFLPALGNFTQALFRQISATAAN